MLRPHWRLVPQKDRAGIFPLQGPTVFSSHCLSYETPEKAPDKDGVRDPKMSICGIQYGIQDAIVWTTHEGRGQVSLSRGPRLLNQPILWGPFSMQDKEGLGMCLTKVLATSMIKMPSRSETNKDTVLLLSPSLPLKSPGMQAFNQTKASLLKAWCEPAASSLRASQKCSPSDPPQTAAGPDL